MSGKCDFEERDDRYEIELEVPGVKKKEITIDLKEDVLTIRWSRTRQSKKGLLKRKAFERSEGSFVRTFRVEGTDPEKIPANLDAGVLRIHLPKREKTKPTHIAI